MIEKRKHSRVSLHIEVGLGQEGIFTNSRRALVDLSEEGALIETTEGFSGGSVFSIRFSLPGARNLISCTACVRNQRNTGLGVQFLDISPDDREKVIALVSDEREGAGSPSDRWPIPPGPETFHAHPPWDPRRLLLRGLDHQELADIVHGDEAGQPAAVGDGQRVAA